MYEIRAARDLWDATDDTRPLADAVGRIGPNGPFAANHNTGRPAWDRLAVDA